MRRSAISGNCASCTSVCKERESEPLTTSCSLPSVDSTIPVKDLSISESNLNSNSEIERFFDDCERDRSGILSIFDLSIDLISCGSVMLKAVLNPKYLSIEALSIRCRA
ncbi:hypothetical protein D3C77_569510 [compost metagenome]